MTSLSDPSAENLMEGVCQKLEPCGSQAQSPSPIQAKSGEWSLRFDYEGPTKLSTVVDVILFTPTPMTVELGAGMDKSQVKNLRDWLTRILNVMQ